MTGKMVNKLRLSKPDNLAGGFGIKSLSCCSIWKISLTIWQEAASINLYGIVLYGKNSGYLDNPLVIRNGNKKAVIAMNR